MKFPEKAQKAMRDPNTAGVNIEMTVERKQRMERISSELIDFLRERVPNPVEAYMVLHFVMESFEETYGIRGGVIVDHGKGGKS